MASSSVSPIRFTESHDDDSVPNFTMLAGSNNDGPLPPPPEDPPQVPRAPLASMEDLSVLATPMTMTPMSTPGPTPGTSPRTTRAAKRAAKAASAAEPIPELDEDTTHTHSPPLLTTYETPLRSLPPPEGRFASPARRNNLMKDALINQAYAPPPHQQQQQQPETPQRQHQSQPLLLPLEEEELPPDSRLSSPHRFATSTPLRGAPPPDEYNNNAKKNNEDDAEESLLLRPIDSQQQQVQFLTPRHQRHQDSVYSSKRSIKKGFGYRVHAAEEEAEFLAMADDPPPDR